MPKPDSIEEKPNVLEQGVLPKSEAERRPEDHEAAPEHPKQPAAEKKETPSGQAQPQPAPQSVAPFANDKPPLVLQIEEVLAEDLVDIYKTMTPQQQLEFKVKGEEAANKIAQLIQSVRIQSQRVLSIIKNWLRFIPGVNRFFLEQEAKIKTDKILALAETQHRQEGVK